MEADIIRKWRNLKRQEPRLRDWNHSVGYQLYIGVMVLKRQEPRLRDWNPHGWYLCDRFSTLETTRTSITKLKLWSAFIRAVNRLHLKRQEPRLRDWNYPYQRISIQNRQDLETTRTSITRLKQDVKGDYRLPVLSLETTNRLFRYKITNPPTFSLPSNSIPIKCPKESQKIFAFNRFLWYT